MLLSHQISKDGDRGTSCTHGDKKLVGATATTDVRSSCTRGAHAENYSYWSDPHPNPISFQESFPNLSLSRSPAGETLRWGAKHPLTSSVRRWFRSGRSGLNLFSAPRFFDSSGQILVFSGARFLDSWGEIPRLFESI